MYLDGFGFPHSFYDCVLLIFCRDPKVSTRHDFINLSTRLSAYDSELLDDQSKFSVATIFVDELILWTDVIHYLSENS